MRRAVNVDYLSAGRPRWLLVDADNSAIGLRDRDAIETDPIASEAIRRLGRGDDRDLGQLARVLVGVDSAKDNRALCTLVTAKVETEGPAIDETLLGRGVYNTGIAGGPTGNIRGEAETCECVARRVISSTKGLLRDLRRCQGRRVSSSWGQDGCGLATHYQRQHNRKRRRMRHIRCGS